MLYLYTDESGDLGFDFAHKRSSKYFTMTALLVRSHDANRRLINAAKKTLARKLNPRRKRRRYVEELKGAQTTLEVKKFLYQQVIAVVQPGVEVYSITINKQQVYERLHGHKERLYNWIAGQLLSRIPLSDPTLDAVELVMDRCKGKPEISEFNDYMRVQTLSRVNPIVPFRINHVNSKESCGLQVCDMFSWGVFQTYEHNNTEWYQIFASVVKCNEEFFKIKNPLSGGMPYRPGGFRL